MLKEIFSDFEINLPSDFDPDREINGSYPSLRLSSYGFKLSNEDRITLAMYDHGSTIKYRTLHQPIKFGSRLKPEAKLCFRVDFPFKFDISLIDNKIIEIRQGISKALGIADDII
jgi:hypothetical protein